MVTPQKHFGLGTGVGLVAGSMIGTGVLVSAGYMAQDLAAEYILLAWILGAALAALGAITYGELSRVIPRSGGEYRFLRQLVHPMFGTLAGWASLLFGFSAPLAINALGAAAFTDTLFEVGDLRIAAVVFIVVPTAWHALSNKTSRVVQNLLAASKVVLVGGFAAIGLARGSSAWPEWSPPSGSDFSLSAFMTGLLFVGFAYTGWNSSVYAASEFRRPGRDVPRSMLLGLALVFALYMIVNWIFVANLAPSESSVVVGTESPITLGHLVAGRLLGEGGGQVMSVIIVMAFLSAISAMTVIGPRVYAEMAEDGVLPKVFGYRREAGKPPTGAVLLQGAVAIGLLLIHSLREMLINASAILLLFTALAAVGLLRAGLSGARAARLGIADPIRRGPLVAAALYALSSAWTLVYAFRGQPSMLLWIAVAAGLAVASYALLGRAQ